MRALAIEADFRYVSEIVGYEQPLGAEIIGLHGWKRSVPLACWGIAGVAAAILPHL
jgi:hypothetical protein